MIKSGSDCSRKCKRCHCVGENMLLSLQGRGLQARVRLRLLLHVQAEMCGAEREALDVHSLRFSAGCVSASFAIQAAVMWCGNLCSRIFSDALHHSVCPDPIPLLPLRFQAGMAQLPFQKLNIY